MKGRCLLNAGRHDGASEANGKEEDQEEREVAAAVAAKLADMQRPPPWIDVTTALRFMTEDGRLVLHHVRALIIAADIATYVFIS